MYVRMCNTLCQKPMLMSRAGGAKCRTSTPKILNHVVDVSDHYFHPRTTCAKFVFLHILAQVWFSAFIALFMCEKMCFHVGFFVNISINAVFGRSFVKRFAVSYQTVVCLSLCPVLSYLSVTLVYYGQTVAWI